MTSDFDSRINLLDEERGVPQPLSGCRSARFLFSKVRINGRLHFVKELRPEFVSDLASRDSLHKEFAIGYNLDHPGIVRYFRYEDTALYEEYIDGENLAQMLDSGDERLTDPATVADIVRQLLEALEYLHSAGVLHLDLKPENVMITRVGTRVKIVDLGCSTCAQFDATPGFTAATKAPEQGVGPTLCATDIYLAGKIIELLARRCRSARRWRKFVERATDENPERRFPSAAEALRAIPVRRSPLKHIALAAVIILLAAAAALIPLLTRAGRDTVAEPATPAPQIVITPPRDTVVREVPVPVAAPAPAPDPLEVLTRQIDSYIKSYYRTNVKPVCLESDNPGSKAARAAMHDATEHCLEYGRRLAADNPRFESEILEQTNVSIGNAQVMTNAWFPDTDSKK